MIDEVVGMMITVSFLPQTGTVWIVGFLLFRFFDIRKPFPVYLFQDKLPGGWGIVMDDVAAGVMANILLQIGVHTLHLL